MKANDELYFSVNRCFGITKNPKENDYMLVFEHAPNGDLHKHLSKSFKEITWKDKIESLWNISKG